MSSPDSPDKDPLLAKMKRDWIDTRHLFSNAGKQRRELWVASEFLRIRGISFAEQDLRLPPQDDPVDVLFGSANFQIKEVPDPNSSRSAEIKVTARQVETARTLEDTVTPYAPSDVPESINGNLLVLDVAGELSTDARYAVTKAKLDLILYVTRTRTSQVRFRTEDQSIFAKMGWRSISALMGNRASVLFAGRDAPAFLKPGDIESAA